jgi:uncharacterized membrane protein HdeD (DUF308 family)
VTHPPHPLATIRVAEMTGEARMDVTAEAYGLDVRDDIRGLETPWWVFLVIGLAWIFVSLFILQFDMDSVWTISVLTGAYLLAAAVAEGFATFVMPGWKWLHALLAVIFTIGGIWSFVYPGQTFGTLALLIGWYLLVKGSFDVVAGLSNRDVHLWWLTLIVGIAEILVAFWAIGYPGRSAWLLVFWIGVGALARGIADIFVAFQVKALQRGVRG